MAAWDPLPTESAQAFAAFCAYRELPPEHRSIDAAFVKATGKQLSGRRAGGAWSKWSWKHHWIERVRAWDAFMDARFNARFADEIADARKTATKRHMAIAQSLQGKVIERLQSLQGQELTVNQMLATFELAFRVERLALGETTENVATTEGQPLPVQVVDMHAAIDQIAAPDVPEDD